ncbi:CsbD family protein [Sphingomonas sp. 4RDLI-65]|uniref:hypothetical protein n=1 Tax=Sphingomonas sp. 4RDLI-65 TaxID=3111641 RepID=UPI003C2030D8
MSRDHETRDDTKDDKGRARRAKGSVQEAIGKIIGDVAVEQRGSRESAAGARQAGAENDIDKDGND